ncbi:MAG: hypothetical protein K2Y25_09305 [Pseudomonadaceae bacterium]|nr:hypothetical protein [Pseudomonadaceae bacterium]
MAITKPEGRQNVAALFVPFVLADISSALAQAAAQLPAAAIVTGGFIVVDEVFNAATTATLVVGDALVANRYAPTPLDLKTLGMKALTVTGYATLKIADLNVTYASSGAAATTGKGRLYLEYIETPKASWTQG